MIEKIRKNNYFFALVFLSFVIVFGVMADINLYRFKYYGELSSNYEFETEVGDIQTEFVVNFPYKVQLIDLNGLVRRVVGQREMNGVIKLNNGYLTEICPSLSEDSINANAEAIIQYNKYCKEKGIVLLYASPAYKISKYDDKLPAGVEDGHNVTMDRLLDRLEDAGVNILDLRQCMHEDGINQYDLYYRTDHHWTTEGAFYAYRQIANWISENTDTYLDNSLLDIRNYQIDTYEEWHLGLRGQRTGRFFAGIDDFDLIYPKFDTRIYNSVDGTVNSLKDSLVNMEVFKNRNAQDRYTYDSAYALNDVNVLSSQDAQTDLKVLLLGDSFRQALKPYMLITYKELAVASYGLLSTAAVQWHQPDVIVILPWPGYFKEDGIYFQYVDDAKK